MVPLRTEPARSTSGGAPGRSHQGGGCRRNSDALKMGINMNILTNLTLGVCLGLVLVAFYGIARLGRRIAWWVMKRV